MAIRRIKAISFSLAVVLILAVSMTFDTPDCTASPTQSEANDELQRDLAHLDSFIEHRDLTAIERTVDYVSAKWRKRNEHAFIAYMSRACNLLSSYDIGDNSNRALLLSRYAMSMLEGETELSLRDQVFFTNFLTFDPLVIGEKDWKGLRKRKAELWLTARQRAANSIDTTFNATDWPQINVAPPRASGLPSGVSAAAIQDPKLREEYENAIAKNAAKARHYNDQHWLQNNAPHFFEEVERYLVTAYTRPPSDVAELERLLAKYVDDNGMRVRVLDAVRKASQ